MGRASAKVETVRGFKRGAGAGFLVFTALLLVAGPLAATATAGGLWQQNGSDVRPAEPGEQAEAIKSVDLPDVVARVNGVPISSKSLIGHLRAAQLKKEIPSGAPDMETYRTILDQIIEFELLFHESEEEGLLATSQQVDRLFGQVRFRYAQEADFLRDLDYQGVDEEGFRHLLQQRLGVQKLIQERIAPRVQVTEEQMREFYEENQTRFQVLERMRVRHILKKLKEAAFDEERAAARQELEALRVQIVEGGASFSEMARLYSDDTGTREHGGELIITRGQTVKPFEDAVLALEPGEVSGIVETEFGYHLITLLERMPAGTSPYKDVKPTIDRILRQASLERELASEVEKLRAAASIEIFF